MTRWPPIVWPLMAVASLFILMGLSSWDAEALIPGVILALAVLGVAIRLATRHRDGRPRPRWVAWAIGGVVAFYAIAIAIAAISGAQYAAVGVLASFFPLAATCLLIATTRSKSAGSDRRPDDVTAEAEDDALPGIGMDSQTRSAIPRSTRPPSASPSPTRASGANVRAPAGADGETPLGAGKAELPPPGVLDCPDRTRCLINARAPATSSSPAAWFRRSARASRRPRSAACWSPGG